MSINYLDYFINVYVDIDKHYYIFYISTYTGG